MSFDEEKEFLEPWLAKAEKRSLVVASPIREALAQRPGQPVKASVVYRMRARHDWRKVAPDTRHPKSDPVVQEAWKKLPEELATLLQPEVTKGRKVRLPFQNEARFGRMVKIRRCWAPAPVRPMVDNGYEREFTYVYGAVSPVEGELDWMICDKMNTERMGEFLAQVSAAHPEEFMVMFTDVMTRRACYQIARCGDGPVLHMSHQPVCVLQDEIRSCGLMVLPSPFRSANKACDDGGEGGGRVARAFLPALLICDWPLADEISCGPENHHAGVEVAE